MHISRKAISLLAVLALMCSLLSVIAVTNASAEETNLIVNGGFETGDLTGWSQEWTDGTFYNSAWSSNAHSGTYSVLGKGNSPWGDRTMFQNITVTPGTTYVFSAWFKYIVENGPTFYFAAIEGASNGRAFYGYATPATNHQSGTVLGAEKITVKDSDHASYSKVTFEFTPTKSTVMIGWCQNGGNGDAFYVDDVSVVEKKAEEPQPEPEFTGIVNGDFENGMEGWNVYRGGGVAATETWDIFNAEWYAHSGTKSLYRTGANSWATCHAYQKIGVVPGKTYTFSAWYKSTSGGGNIVFSVAKDSDNSGVLEKKSVGANSSYSEVTFDFTPKTETEVAITISQEGGNVNNAMYFFVDDVTVVEKKAEEPEPEFTGIVNGGFEDGMTGWSELWKQVDAFSEVCNDAHTGEKALRRSGASGQTWGNDIVYQTIDVTPGKAYVLDLWFKYTCDNAPNFVFGVVEGTNAEDLYRDRATVLQSLTIAVNNKDHAEYSKVTMEFVPGTTKVTVAFYQNGGVAYNDGYPYGFYVDDVSVTEKGGEAAGVIFTNQVISKSDLTPNTATITWGKAGGVSAAADVTYSVYVSESLITLQNIASLTPFTTVAGTGTLKATATGLKAGTYYYFAVKVADKTPTEAPETVTLFSGAIRTISDGSEGAAELLVNGGFENIKVNTGADQGFSKRENDGETGWWGMVTASSKDLAVDDFGSARRKITSTDKYEGNYAFSFSKNSDLYYSLVQSFNVLKGYKYTVSFWYKGEAGAVAGLGPDWNAHGSGGYDLKITTNADSEWTKYTMVYYPSSDGEQRLWLSGASKSGNGECIYDNVSVMEEFAPLYFTTTYVPVDKITKDSIVVSWPNPTVQAGVAPVTNYKVYVSENPINNDNVTSLAPAVTVAAGTLTATLTGLKPNTGYYLAVEVTNGTKSGYIFNTNATYTQKDEPAPAAGTNLIIDGGFDLSEDFSQNPREGWHRNNNAGEIFLFWGGVHADVGDSMKLGSVCVYPWQQQLVQWVQVKPNTTYAYSFCVEGYLADGGPGLRVHERANGVWNGKTLANTKLTAATDGMENFQGKFTTGPDTTEVYINLYNAISGSNGAGGQCYFDEIYLVEIEDTSLYMLGGITQVESGEDYLIVTWPKAVSTDSASNLTYHIFADDNPITAATIGSLTAFAEVKGDAAYIEAELGDLKPGTVHYFAVSVTDSQGRTAYLFSDSAFMTDGEAEEDDPSGDNPSGDDPSGDDPSGDNPSGGDEDDPTSPITGDSVVLLTVALLVVLLSGGVLVYSKRRVR